jgi:hypothetical protein
VISPAVAESEPADGIAAPVGREEMRVHRRVSIPAEAIAHAIAFPDPAGVSYGGLCRAQLVDH